MSTFANPPRYSAETAAAYIRALLDLLGDREPLALLARGPERIRAACAGLSTSGARKPEAEGKWSAVEVVRHLADSEIVYGYRMRLIVAAERPAIPGYDQDAWAERLRYRDGDLPDALDDFQAARITTMRWLRSRTPEERARVGLHSERGEESVTRSVKLLAAHDLVHERQIERIRAAIA